MKEAIFFKMFSVSYTIVIRFCFIFVLFLSLIWAQNIVSQEHTIESLMSVVQGPENKYNVSDRWDAIIGIGRIGNLEAAQTLVSLLDGPYHIAALQALTHIEDRSALPLLISQLSSENELVRSNICLPVGKIGGADAVKALATIARDDSLIDVRRIAVAVLEYELQRDPHGPVIPALIELAEFEELYENCAKVLFTIDDESAISKLHPGLESGNPNVRKLVCNIVNRKDHVESTDVLIALLSEEQDERVLISALSALADICPQEKFTEMFKSYKNFLSNDDAVATTGFEELVTRIKRHPPTNTHDVNAMGKVFLSKINSENESIRTAAMTGLAAIRYQKAAPHLIKKLGKKIDNRYEKNVAIKALAACLHTEEQTSFLIKLSKQNPDDEQAVLDSLSLINHPAAAGPLATELEKDKRFWGRDIINVLIKLKNPIASKSLIETIRSRDHYDEEAAIALSSVGTKDDLPQILTLLKAAPQNHNLRKSFFHIDRTNNFFQTKKLIKSSEDENHTLLNNILVSTYSLPVDENILLQALMIDNIELKRTVIERLEQIDSKRVMLTMCDLLKNTSDTSIRESAASALSEFSNKAAIKQLAATYSETYKNNNLVTLNERLNSSLRNISGHDFQSPDEWLNWIEKGMDLGSGITGLIKALGNDNVKIKQLAAREIARLPNARERHKAVEPILKEIDKDGDWKTLGQLYQALGKIGDKSVAPILLDKITNSCHLETLTFIAKALSDLGVKKGAEHLLEALESDKSPCNYEEIELFEAIAISTGAPLSYDTKHWKAWFKKES